MKMQHFGGGRDDVTRVLFRGLTQGEEGFGV